jgi:WD40 repeat protein
LAFSPDSKTLAVMDDAGVGLYNGPNWEQRAMIASPGSRVGYLAFALEGRCLALLRLPGSSVELWDLATQKKTAEIDTGVARVMIVSPNGRWLAVGNEAGELLLWDLPAQTLLLRQKLHARWLFALAFSPDGQSLATGGGDQLIHLWDTSMLPQSELTRRATLRGHRSEVWSLAFSSDGAILASGSKDDTVKLWRAANPTEPFTRLPAMPGATLLLGFVPQNQQVLTLTPQENELQLWDALVSKVVRRVPIHSLGAVIFNAPYVFFGTTNGTAEIWTVPAGERLREVQLTEGPITALAGSSDQKFLLVWDKTHEIAALWDLQTGRRLAAFPDFASEMAVGPWRKAQWATFSPDDRWLAYASTNYTIKIRDLQKGTEAFTLRGHAWHVDCLRFSADSSRLASGSWDAEARVWDVATGRETVPPLKGHLSGIGGLSFSADGRTLAVWSGEDLHFWSLENGSEMLTIPKVAAWFSNIIAPDGNAMVWEEGAFTGHFRIQWLPTLTEIDRLEQAR